MVSDYLKSLKEQSKMTSKQICEISKVPESTFSRILSGATSDPSFSTVQALVSAMGGDMNAIGSDVKPPEKEAPENVTIDLYRIAHGDALNNCRTWRILSFILLGANIFLIIVLVALFTYDILNGNVGWFRYSAHYLSEAFREIFGGIA